MDSSLASISILIITYNQEDVIGRAIDSVIIQKNWGLKEIVICDDCSTDNNWEIISKYVKKYPTLIKAYRNDTNYGIYGNCNKVISLRGNADLFYLLSGDDALVNGFFEKIQFVVTTNSLNLNNDEFTIYFDWIAIRPNGVKIRFSNNKIQRNVSAFRLRLRLLIYNRSAVISKNVINKFSPVPLDKGITLSENLFELQYQLHSKKNIYYPYVGSIYYSQIGISTTMKTKKHQYESIYKWNYILTNFDLCEKDKSYVKLNINHLNYSLNPSIKNFLYIIQYYLKSRDLSLGWDLKQDYFLIRSILRGIKFK